MRGRNDISAGLFVSWVLLRDRTMRLLNQLTNRNQAARSVAAAGPRVATALKRILNV